MLALILVMGGIITWLEHKERKRIMEELGLVKGAVYDVLTNDGKTSRNMTFHDLGRGNRSTNGTMNLYFFRPKRFDAQFGDDPVYRKITIKYRAIHKVVKIKDAPPETIH